VCGGSTVFRYNSWSIDPALLAAWGDPVAFEPYLRRESMFCGRCGSNLRTRQLAASLMSAAGLPSMSVRDAIGSDRFASSDILEINELGSTGSMHSVLVDHPHLTSTEYRGPEGLGRPGPDGRLNEDMTSLSFPDGSFDIVLHSDTLEHVPDPRAAMGEVQRVLRPGGLHVFTVPVLASRACTEARAEVVNGVVHHFSRPLYHGRGGGPYARLPEREDFLEFTSFGKDLAEWSAAPGLAVEVERHAWDPLDTGAAWVVIARA